VETLTDVVSVDEKPQVHALDRTHPGVPMKKGRCGPLTHDYKPHHTTYLFAALTVLDGAVIGTCYPRHRPRHVARAGPPLDPDNDGRTTTPLLRSGWRDLHNFSCTLRRRVPRG